MFLPVKEAFGKYMRGYFETLQDNARLSEYLSRPFERAVVMAPGRMVDAQEEMLLKYYRVDDQEGPTHPHKLPIIIVAFAKDTIPTGRDYTRQIADKVLIEIPGIGNPVEVRTSSIDIRAQVVVNTMDEPSARSLMAQFLVYVDETPSRRFWSTYLYEGKETHWPVQIEDNGPMPMTISSDAKNLTTLAVDLTLKATVPLFYEYEPALSKPVLGTGPVGKQPKGKYLDSTMLK